MTVEADETLLLRVNTGFKANNQTLIDTSVTWIKKKTFIWIEQLNEV